jgi:hypothetical protein
LFAGANVVIKSEPAKLLGTFFTKISGINAHDGIYYRHTTSLST